MLSNSDQLSPGASALSPVIDQAASILMGLLHCGEAEALALLRAQSEAASVDLVQVAAALLERDAPEWRWG